MIKARKLNNEGIKLFTTWLENPIGETPPSKLMDSDLISVPFGDYDIDPSKEFITRQYFGECLNEWFSGADFNFLMSPESDGVWAWLAIVYFKQLTAKGIRRKEHYVITRNGSAGSLAYRHAARTSYELVHIHGDYAYICLKSPMHTFGDMTEQLASRQTIAHNKGFFKTAFTLYMHKGGVKRGAASRPKNPKEREPGEKTGLGSVRRLAIALQRLDLTYDTEIMESALMKSVLPREFKKWE